MTQKLLTNPSCKLGVEKVYEVKGIFYYLSHLSLVSVVVKILRDGVTIDGRDGYNRKALDWTAASNQESVVNELLENGSDVNVQNRGWTPVHKAAYNNSGVMKTLLHHSADRSIVNNKGATTLDTAPV